MFFLSVDNPIAGFLFFFLIFLWQTAISGYQIWPSEAKMLSGSANNNGRGFLSYFRWDQERLLDKLSSLSLYIYI